MVLLNYHALLSNYNNDNSNNNLVGHCCHFVRLPASKVWYEYAFFNVFFLNFFSIPHRNYFWNLKLFRDPLLFTRPCSRHVAGRFSGPKRLAIHTNYCCINNLCSRYVFVFVYLFLLFYFWILLCFWKKKQQQQNKIISISFWVYFWKKAKTKTQNFKLRQTHSNGGQR